MFFLNKHSNFEKKPHELSYRSNNTIFIYKSATEIVKSQFAPVYGLWMLNEVYGERVNIKSQE